MKSIFLSVFLCFVVAGASAQQDNGIEINAPAGFAWGETKQQIENKGIAFECYPGLELELWCTTDSAPKEISFVKEYKLIFIKGYGLQGVEMFTGKFTDDPYGYEGKQLYDKVKQILISKYGQPRSLEFIGKDLYDKDDKFYQCLEYAECGDWSSLWFGEGSILLRIQGSKEGVGVLRIGYVSKNYFNLHVNKDQEAL